MKAKLWIGVLATMMMLTTACSKPKSSEESSGATVDAKCENCEGFVAGATVFQGSLSGGSSRMDLQIIADANSLSTAANSYSNPKTRGTYQGLVAGGTFTASGAACLPDGDYQVQGLQVGTVSQSLSTQASNPMWVTLSGPATVKAPLYIQMADANNDDVADGGTRVYLWVYCNAWTRVDLTSY